jgi:uncharacterized membrane protein YdjX (TVP38/TMEM64 family)
MFSRFFLEVLLALDIEGWVRQGMAEPGAGAAALILVLLSVDLLLPVPSSLVMVLSGVLFGVLGGGLLSLVGSLAGNFIGFELARAYGRTMALRFSGERQVDQMTTLFDRYGLATIVASRPLPILMETLSVVAGLSGLDRRRFLVASLAGTIPTVFAYSWAGAASIGMETVFAGLVVLVAVPAVFWVVFRMLFGRRS